MITEFEMEQVKATLSAHGYEYKDFLGKGGFSEVLLCESTKYKQKFAVKRAYKHDITDEEYNFLIKLNHPNIIRLYDAFSDEFTRYFVFEYCNNGTISDKGKLTNSKFITYAKQILQAISFCHSNNIAHRDLKPENIFLDQYDQVKLADFGMAKQFEIDTKSAEKCGSLMFLAPEAFLYQEINPFKADIWALGITFFYMATGKYPFRNASKEEMQQHISRGEIDFRHYEIHPTIKALIKKMTIKDQNNRPTVDKLLELPIFSQTINKNVIFISKSQVKLSPQSFHTTCSIQSHKSLTFEQIPVPSEVKNNDNDGRGINGTMADVHSYRRLNLYPRIRRVNGRVRAPINST